MEIYGSVRRAVLVEGRSLHAYACQTLPIRSGVGQLGDRRCSGILAVQRRYKDYLYPSVPKRFLRYIQSDRCPLSSFVCNRLTPFHGDNTGSNPVGDAKLQLAVSDRSLRFLSTHVVMQR